MSEQIVVLDEGGMLGKIHDLPNQFEKAWTSLWTKDVDVNIKGVTNVIICGMGGSGISGLLLQELTREASTVPIHVWSDYSLPGWVNEDTLVIACSFSGDTEETLDAVKVAVEKKCRIAAITSGGKLAELSKIHNFPIVSVTYESSPRAAIGWLYGSLLTLMAKLELVGVKENNYFQALDELKKTVDKKIFPPKAEELAISLNNKIPLIFAHSPLASLAKRWVNQLNENSKTFAFAGVVPELCHNTIVGTEFAVPEKLMILYLESKYGFSRNNARHKILHKWFDKEHIPFVPLSVKSGSLLAEQWLLIYFGDLLSFYLAGVYGADPSPIEPIKFLKEELGKL
ncbi:MAG: bifunctional phosphoglucose/phosphomannose isomerase [Candidatus Berkelbacteria bacterium]|nr:MAG: bifunctional phosphoglucose/phosphomannose isomerase [Candidatus Berkelbacteria bacterium]QQG51380.1 MAG: bifunctional phosphoglucose/phosphomannose isomerase [Candidatus Berkelbacteria bacterium]